MSCIKLTLYNIRGHKIRDYPLWEDNDVDEVMKRNASKILWVAEDVEKDCRNVRIGLGVIPEEVLEKHGLGNIQMKKGAGYNC